MQTLPFAFAHLAIALARNRPKERAKCRLNPYERHKRELTDATRLGRASKPECPPARRVSADKRWPHPPGE